VVLRNVTAGDGDQAGNARFRSHQVVVVGVEPVRLDVIADMKNVPLRVIQEAKGHRLQEGFGA